MAKLSLVSSYYEGINSLDSSLGSATEAQELREKKNFKEATLIKEIKDLFYGHIEDEQLNGLLAIIKREGRVIDPGIAYQYPGQGMIVNTPTGNPGSGSNFSDIQRYGLNPIPTRKR